MELKLKTEATWEAWDFRYADGLPAYKTVNTFNIRELQERNRAVQNLAKRQLAPLSEVPQHINELTPYVEKFNTAVSRHEEPVDSCN